MKKATRRVWSIFLAFMMLISMLPMSVSAEEGDIATIVDSGSFASLEDAFEAADDGATIQLIDDTAIDNAVKVTKTVTLDLNGYNITSNGLAFYVDTDDVVFTIQDNDGTGSVKSTETDNSNLIEVSKGDLVVEGGQLFNAWYVIYVSQTGEATVKGGVLTSSVASVLSTNGSQKGNENYSGTAVMNVEDGTLISEKDVAIYLPAGALNISGGTIKGATAVYSKSGITRITGNPTIISESEATGFTHSPNGCIASGDAMLIEACGYPNGEPEVYISGGIFTNENAKGLAYYQFEGHTAKEISITGGRFSNDVSKYVDDGCTLLGNADDGYYVVAEGNIPDEDAVASIGNSSYSSLAAAVDVAGNGDTITMVNDAQLSSAVEINKELTLDLAGHTITGSASALSAIAVTGNLTITDSTAKEEPVVSPDYQTVDYEAGKIEIASSKGAAVSVQEGGQLTVEGGILENTGNIGLGVHGNSDPETWSTPIGSTATINGGLVLAREYGIGVYGNGAVLNVNDGVISTVDNAAVAGNGSCNGEVNHGGTTIHISGGTLIGHITTPGYIANGIYHPQSGVLNITGGTIYADNGLGVLMRNGGLNISGDATVIATGSVSGQVGDHPANVPGNTVVIDFAEDYNHNNEPNDTRKVSISGGYFSANQDTITVVDGENNKSVDSFVTGGSFTKQPDASYIADGCVVVNSGDANYPLSDSAS